MRASRDMTRDATRTVIERGSKCGRWIEIRAPTPTPTRTRTRRRARGGERAAMGERETRRSEWDGCFNVFVGRAGSREHAGTDDANGLDRSVAATRGRALDGADDVHALDDVPERHVATVEPRGGGGGDEELRSVRVGTRIRHRDRVWPVAMAMHMAMYMSRWL